MNVEHERSSLTFGVNSTSDRYQSSNEFDNDTFAISVSYARAITSLMQFSGRLVVTNRDFQSTPQEYSDRRLILGLEKAFSRKLTLSAELEHSTRGNASALNFDENLFALHIRYDLNPPPGSPISD